MDAPQHEKPTAIPSNLYVTIDLCTVLAACHSYNTYQVDDFHQLQFNCKILKFPAVVHIESKCHIRTKSSFRKIVIFTNTINFIYLLLLHQL